MTRFRIRRKIKKTTKGVALGVACCTVIYASMLLITAKSMLRMHIEPIDM